MAWGDSLMAKLAGARENGEGLVTVAGDLLARHGWTIVLVLLVFYNVKDGIRRRWRTWQNLASGRSHTRIEPHAGLCSTANAREPWRTSRRKYRLLLHRRRAPIGRRDSEP
ncbi:unnamed protein product [Ascophyllum nodosum]